MSEEPKKQRATEDTRACLRWIGAGKRFGGVQALSDFSLDVLTGEIHGLIGPNGAGKSTAVNVATGAYRLDGGQVLLGDVDISRLSSHQRARLGLGRTFQHPHTFESLTVRENLDLAAGNLNAASDPGDIDGLLALLDMQTHQHDLAEWLTFGQQKLLSVAQALLWGTRVILLDEPMAGLSPNERQVVKGLISGRREVGIVLIEHDVDMVMAVCDQVTVMVSGSVIAQGQPGHVRADARVIEAYLGSDADAAGQR